MVKVRIILGNDWHCSHTVGDQLLCMCVGQRVICGMAALLLLLELLTAPGSIFLAAVHAVQWIVGSHRDDISYAKSEL